MDNYQQFIHKSRYARWMEDEGRRETWQETVERLMHFLRTDPRTNKLEPSIYRELSEAIEALEVMPSMRSLMTAGPALSRNNIAGFNCAYCPVDDVRAFDEILYILMNGTGIGFSVELEEINKLPVVPRIAVQQGSDSAIVVEDSKEGWAHAYRELISALYEGTVRQWDVSKVREAGERLKVFGGRASGPQPLIDLFVFTQDVFARAQGRRLTSIEVHDIICKIAEVVVVGGVRRSALISLSDLTDGEMRHAKSGNWFDNNIQRALANNSVAYAARPDIGTFMDEWLSLYRSGSGERGIFNRQAAIDQASKNGRRATGYRFGTNPCSEIILRPNQFCNLTEIVARAGDSFSSLAAKVRLATILGTLQSCLTDFKYIRQVWKDNTDEERLLGVSITGIMDCELLNGDDVDLDNTLIRLKHIAIATNATISTLLGVPASAAITCVKPSGTVSQLVDAASGIHDRHSPLYIRTVRGDNKDPITQFLKDQGVVHEPDVTKPDGTAVFSFAIASPAGSVYRADRSAIEQLDHWLMFQRHWCEHKPSVTISVKEHEWMEVGAWVWEHFDEVSGISFLPYSNANYAQMPYQEVEKEEWDVINNASPVSINWTDLDKYESEDNTASSQTLACTGGVCEIVDIGGN